MRFPNSSRSWNGAPASTGPGSSGLDGTTRRPRHAPPADMCGRAPKTSVSVSGPARNAGRNTTGT